MKNFPIVLTVILLIFCNRVVCQEYTEPEWKFHFAFEDATGARDTVWLYQDSGMNSWSPEEYSSYGIFPFSIPSDEFSVYTDYSQSDYGKVAVGNIEWPMDVYIYASNYTYPITLSWDTALFNAPVLQETTSGIICNPRMDNDWFFFQTNASWLHHQYSMIFENQIVLPSFDWGSEDHFPITAYFDRSHSCNPLSSSDENVLQDMLLSPNPCVDYLELRTDTDLQNVEVYDLNGRVVLSLSGAGIGGGSGQVRLDVSMLPAGMYLLSGSDAQGRVGVRKFVKEF